ncbi:MAG: response regulator [Maribacter sp.]|nr:response regulator [Maribacter sp.]
MAINFITKSTYDLKAKKLVSQLSQMETMLDAYSFEELTSDEASHLKKTFNAFKKCLDQMIFKPVISSQGGQGIEIRNQATRSTGLMENKTTVNSTMLIAKVSHEIRTPLNGIIGFTDLLREEGLSNRQLSQINAIQSASNSLMEIINELLEYSKLSSGLGNFETTNFYFQNVINEVVYLCNTLITRKEVNLRTAIDPNIPTVLRGDPSKLSQLLINLLGNAIKFVEKGEILLNIKIKERIKNSIHLEFIIKDSGIGISKKNLKHIFDPFKQADNNTFVTYGGSGLGLSIVKQIIEKCKGEITVTSKLGVGTTFTFFLPYEIGKDKDMVNKEESTLNLDEGIKQVSKMNILVYEDNILNQKLIETRLKSWGCQTFITDDAYRGIDVLENHPIDIVLMDLRMPGMNGFEVTDLIRQHSNPNIKNVPVIALSADFTAQNEEECKVHGINDFILKPYSQEELLSKLINNKISEPTSSSKPVTTSDCNKNPIVDLTSLLDDCMGEFELLENLISLFKQNALEFIGACRIHLKNKNYEGFGFASHKIKSGLAMLKTNSLLSIVEKIHEYGKKGTGLEELEILYTAFIKEYSLIDKAIDIDMAKLRKIK